MKLSCNGCRILRKGCSDNCIIRPCLEWINSPESQANTTLFLAKFYGRTGLINLITAAPHHLRPVVFKSLMYEACGRLVNPTYGSLGLFWSGEWAQCEAAVDAVLTGSKINGVEPSDWHISGTLASDHILSTCDIRHMPKGTNVGDMRGRNEFTKVRPKKQVGSMDSTILWKPNWQKEKMKAVKVSLVSQNELNRADETELDLELTLGFRCQSTYGHKTRY